ncbi:MAG: hypothetical protein KTR31_20665 [Myxococcales bacterium]|nr:hypothetical protein [Myxococcales bacterium]
MTALPLPRVLVLSIGLLCGCGSSGMQADGDGNEKGWEDPWGRVLPACPVESPVSEEAVDVLRDAEEGLARLDALDPSAHPTPEMLEAFKSAALKTTAAINVARQSGNDPARTAVRTFLARRGVDYGTAAQHDAAHFIAQLDDVDDFAGENTPLLRDAVKASGEESIGAVAFKYGGRVVLVLGVVDSVVHVYMAEDTGEAISGEVGAWAGSYAGAELAGYGCALTGVEVIVPLCALVGGILGGVGGSELGRELWDAYDSGCRDPSTGWDGCSLTIRPPYRE